MACRCRYADGLSVSSVSLPLNKPVKITYRPWKILMHERNNDETTAWGHRPDRDNCLGLNLMLLG